jgi:hypothetical protein
MFLPLTAGISAPVIKRALTRQERREGLDGTALVHNCLAHDMAGERGDRHQRDGPVQSLRNDPMTIRSAATQARAGRGIPARSARTRRPGSGETAAPPAAMTRIWPVLPALVTTAASTGASRLSAGPMIMRSVHARAGCRCHPPTQNAADAELWLPPFASRGTIQRTNSMASRALTRAGEIALPAPGSPVLHPGIEDDRRAAGLSQEAYRPTRRRTS